MSVLSGDLADNYNDMTVAYVPEVASDFHGHQRQQIRL